jgi:outer membrane lipoprotein-sorting protein
MNCTQCEERLVDYAEGLLGDQAAAIEAHLAECPACRARLEELKLLSGALKESVPAVDEAFAERVVMNRIITEQATELRRLKMKKRLQLIGAGTAAVAALAACIALFVFLGPAENGRALAAEVLAKGAAEASNLKAVHLKCRMRSLPNENFMLVGPTYDFIEMDVWRQFGGPLKYRIEKPGRVVVSDGESAVMFIKDFNRAMKGPAGADFDASWLRDLADLEGAMSAQLRDSLAGEGNLSTARETVDGKLKLTVTAEVKPADVGEYLRGKFMMTSDTRRVLRFDAETRRLEAVKIFMHAKPEDVLVFEVTAIEYNPELPASIFKLELPKDVSWLTPPAPLPDNEKYVLMKPKEVAQAFFDACDKNEWDEVQKFWSGKVDDRMKKFLSDLKLVSLGEPFQSKPFPGWFVPYEVTSRSSSETRKFNLAIRNDNPAKRWVVDGGL